jgi:hypothetical protein
MNNVILKSRRFGKLRYTHTLLEDSFKAIQAIYSKIVPLEVKYDLSCDTFEVTALSPLFDLVEQGQIAPEYHAIIECLPGYGVNHTINVTFKKKDPK